MRFPYIYMPWRAHLSRDARAAVVLGVCLCTLALSVAKTWLLPEYFFFDAQTLEQFSSWAELTPGDSYSSTAAIYAAIGVSLKTLWWPLTSACCVLAVFGAVLLSKDRTALRADEFAILAIFLMLSAVYLTTLSKDFVVLLLVLAFWCGASRISGIILWSVLAGFYGFYFRSYWYLFVALFWLYFFAIQRGVRLAALGALILCSICALALAFAVVMGVDLDNYRVTVNEVRLATKEEFANTAIEPFIPGASGFFSAVNVVLTFFSLLFPVPLLIKGSVYYSTIALFLVTVTWRMLVSYRAVVMLRDTRVSASFAAVLAFIVTQSLFEPDYGSYLRHLTPFFPLMVAIFVANHKS